MAYEALLLAGVLFIAFLAPQAAFAMAWGFTAPGALLIAHLVLVVGVYFVWQWRHGGQTLAMKTWRLRLVGIDGAPPALSQLLLRQLLCWPSILCYGAGLLWAFFDRERQFLHDRLAGTRIINVFPPTTASPRPRAGKSRSG